MLKELSKPVKISLCRECRGTGKVEDKVCGQCEGSGRVTVSCQMTLDIRPYKPKNNSEKWEDERVTGRKNTAGAMHSELRR